MHSTALYRCPVCREQTIVPWHKRTRNVALEQLCEDLPEYANRAAEIGEVEPLEDEEGSYDSNTDLAKLASLQQDHLVLSLYDEVMPALFEAAKEGRAFITVEDQSVVKSLHRVGDAFSTFLFDRHNVYRVVLTSNDATFHFSRRSIRTRNDFVNSSFLSPVSTSQDSTLSEVSLPSQPSIFSRISSMIDSVERRALRAEEATPLPHPPPLPSLMN